MKEKILICDDDDKQTERFENKVNRALNKIGADETFKIKRLSQDEFEDSITTLRDRQIGLREYGDFSNKTTKFDGASICIIDYDLLKNEARQFLTGENLAYSVRCFSTCKLIVGLNQFGNNSFDLTLKGHSESFADLNLGEDQLDNPNLWQGTWTERRQTFRPWYWPNLADSLRNFDDRVQDVKQNLDKPICKVLGFDSDMFRLLPRAVVQFIGKGDDKEPVETTFRDFVTESGNGLRPKDKEISKGEVLARVGAARISKWLERCVLPEQDILVDAPHLVSRYPSLIEGDRKKIGTWNKTAQLVGHHQLGLNSESIEPYRFKKEHWISRPVWFWDQLREHGRIKELTDPWLTAKPDWVFCEDASRFYRRNGCREFLADTSSPFTRRFAKGFKNVDYRPRVRFSL